MIEKLWAILSTFTAEAFEAAETKCKELGFDPNRGVISLAESLKNLSDDTAVLRSVIERRHLIQLPITTQKTILSHAESISRALSSLAANADEVVNLVNAIEALHLMLWQYGINKIPISEIDFLEKQNQIKKEEIELSSIRREIKQSLKAKNDLNELLSRAQEIQLQLQDASQVSQKSLESVSNAQKTALESSQKVQAVLASADQAASNLLNLLAGSKTSSAELAALEARIKEFYATIEQNRIRIEEINTKAQLSVQQNTDKTNTLISQLKDLELQISDAIQKATGFSLFTSFQTRKEEIQRSKLSWAVAILGLVVASIGLSLVILLTTKEIETAFWIKLSMSLPLIYAITFCTVQYSRERRLEEEYAFKSNISVSLVPYKDFLYNMLDKQQPIEKSQFTAFIIDSITKIYTPPSERAMDGEDRPHADSDKALKRLGSTLDAIVKPLEPLLKALRHQ